ncbi:MAG: hypothetical protein ACMXYA_01630 [Candidatus Woesearchaeota archaeon]
MISEEITKVLRAYTHVPHISLAPRANAAIKKSLKFAKEKGYTTVLIPDEGGWMTYEPFAKKIGLEVEFLKTNHGILIPEKCPITAKSVLLIHTLAGYHSKQPTEALRKLCDAKNALFIEDMCGAPHIRGQGHIILGSFGNAKPINFGTGGFIGTENAEWFEKLKFSTKLEEPVLLEKVKNVKERLHQLYKKKTECIQLLEEKGLLYWCDEYGIVIIVPFEQSPDPILNIAKKCHVEYETCPRYIRTLTQAISLEIKRN